MARVFFLKTLFLFNVHSVIFTIHSVRRSALQEGILCFSGLSGMLWVVTNKRLVSKLIHEKRRKERLMLHS